VFTVLYVQQSHPFSFQRQIASEAELRSTSYAYKYCIMVLCCRHLDETTDASKAAPSPDPARDHTIPRHEDLLLAAARGRDEARKQTNNARSNCCAYLEVSIEKRRFGIYFSSKSQPLSLMLSSNNSSDFRTVDPEKDDEQ
jgi:hypothetical protein